MKVTYRIGIFFLWIVFSCCLGQSRIEASERSVSLHFGKVSTVAGPISLKRDIPFYVIPAKISGLQIETTPLSGTHTQQSIPVEQLSFCLDGQAYPLSGSTISVPLSGNSSGNGGILNPVLDLELEPGDLADEYTGYLTITPWSENSAGKTWGSAITVNVAITIKPWIKISCEPQSVTLEQSVYSEFGLQNTQPIQFYISSNCNWVLYCRLTSSPTAIEPVVKVETPGSVQLKVLNGSGGFTDNRMDLAIGCPTSINKNNSCHVEVSVSVQNFVIIPAKEYTVPLQFAAEVWDEKQ